MSHAARTMRAIGNTSLALVCLVAHVAAAKDSIINRTANSLVPIDRWLESSLGITADGCSFTPTKDGLKNPKPFQSKRLGACLFESAWSSFGFDHPNLGLNYPKAPGVVRAKLRMPLNPATGESQIVDATITWKLPHGSKGADANSRIEIRMNPAVNLEKIGPEAAGALLLAKTSFPRGRRLFVDKLIVTTSPKAFDDTSFSFWPRYSVSNALEAFDGRNAAHRITLNLEQSPSDLRRGTFEFEAGDDTPAHGGTP